MPASYITQDGQQEVCGATCSGLCAIALDVKKYHVHYCALLVPLNHETHFYPKN